MARYAAFVIAPTLACLTLTSVSSANDDKPKAAEESAPSDGVETRERPRDGEQIKRGPRDGEGRKTGPRDGEEKKTGPRDGEGRKSGMRDGERKKTGLEDGAARGKGTRDGEGFRRRGGDGDAAPKGADGRAVVLMLIDKGERVSIGGETLPLGKLRGYFSRQGKEMSLVVKCDHDVPYKAVTEVLDAARDNGITDVAFAIAGEDGGESEDSSKER